MKIVLQRDIDSRRYDRSLYLGFGLVAFGMLALSTPQLARAQAAVDDGNELEEIIVTSRKKEETIIDAPQAITAFSEATLTDYNVQSFADYGNKVPNMSFNDGSIGRARVSASRGISIRGMVGGNTTSMYIDDTPIPVTQNPRIADVARIEVLKGPQGTLYGSAAIGGTVRIITKQPSFSEEETRYTLSAGQTNHGGSQDFGGSAIANFVLSPETLAVRVMGFLNHDSGYVTRIAPSTDRSSIMSEYKNTGEVYQSGASLSALLKLSDSFDATFKLLGQRESMPNGFPLVYRGNPGYDPTTLTIQRDYNAPESATNSWWLPALTLDYHADKWGVVSSTSLYKQDSWDNIDSSEAMHEFLENRPDAGAATFYQPGYVSGTPIGYSNFGASYGGGGGRTENFQQELRVSITPFDSLSGLVGAYYQHAASTNASNVRNMPGIAASGWSIYGPTNDIGTDVYFNTFGSSLTTQTAFFTDWSYTLFDKLTIDAGLRKYKMETTGTTTSQGFAIGLTNPVTSKTTPQKSDGYSPKLSISFEPDKDTNVYVTAAKGFRPGGGATTTPPLVQCQDEIFNQLGISLADYLAGYKSDSVWTYELGAKKAIGGFTVMTDVFQTDWKDIQQNISLKCGTNFTGNAGAARIRGFEFELSGNLFKDLSMRLGYGYNSGEITDDAGGRTAQKVGDKLANAPKSNATVGLVYTHGLTDTLQGVVSADWSYVGSSLSINNSSTSPAQRSAYSITNLRFGVRSGQNETTLYINNVFDELANYGDSIPDRSENFLVNGAYVPHTRVSVSRPLNVGLQYRHGF
ncbi:MAG: TonB-dependent receptor [Steroidobacteraceae bacterium]